MSTPASQLPFLPQKLPQTQAEWQQALNILQQWQQQLNALNAAVSPPVWTTLTLANNWVYWGTPYLTPAYYEDAFGRVYCRGLIKLGTAADGTVIAKVPTLPPTGQVLAIAQGFNGTSYQEARMDVDTSGNILIFNLAPVSGAWWVSLNDLSWQTV